MDYPTIWPQLFTVTIYKPTEFSNPAGVRGVQYSHPNDAVASDAPLLMPNGGTKFGEIKGITEFDGRDIMYERKGWMDDWHAKDEVESTGASGNRGGHNIEDNDFIFDIIHKDPGYVAPRKDVPKPVTPPKKSGG